MISIQEKLKEHMIKKNLDIIKVSLEITKGGWCDGAQKLQVEVMKEIEDTNGFTKYDVDGISVYIDDELELRDEVEIQYLYYIPLIGTIMKTSGIRIRD